MHREAKSVLDIKPMAHLIWASLINLTILLSSSSLLQHFFVMGPCLSLSTKHLFGLSHRKTRWTMLLNQIGFQIRLLGISNSMITLTFFPWCKMKWSQDEFNNQSQILQGLGMTSWSIM
jgi:hypothetical protein